MSQDKHQNRTKESLHFSENHSKDFKRVQKFGEKNAKIDKKVEMAKKIKISPEKVWEQKMLRQSIADNNRQHKRGSGNYLGRTGWK